MSRNNISPVVYVTCGAVVTLGMMVIKFIAWATHQAIVVFLLHE